MMKTLLSILLMCIATFAWAGEKLEPIMPSTAVVKGEVLEVINVENFVYLRLKTQSGETWAATNKAAINKGATVTLENVITMNNFESKSLKRTFDSILFGTLSSTQKGAASTSSLGAAFNAGAAHTNAPQLESINSNTKIEKAQGADAKTVMQIATSAGKLKEKKVVVRGKVVKYNPDIMGKNWVHLQDGTGSEANQSNDILVTTTSKTSVGQIVTVKGIVRGDKDFGAGYAYKVLVEDATLE